MVSPGLFPRNGLSGRKARAAVEVKTGEPLLTGRAIFVNKDTDARGLGRDPGMEEARLS
jgi:hypothetical protein